MSAPAAGGGPDRRSPDRRTRPTGRQRRAEARLSAEQARAAHGERSGLPTVVLAVGVAAVVALLLGLALATGFLTPPGSSSGSSTTAAASTHIVVRSDAADVAFASGSGWLVDDTKATIRRFDPSSGAFRGAALSVGRRPVGLAAGYGRLWVADAVGNAVDVVDPTRATIDGGPISVASEPVSVAAGLGGIWVASLGANTVSLIDPRTRTVTASVALPDGAVRVALGDGAVWVTGETDTLTRIEPRPLGVSLQWRSIRVGQGPIGLVAAPGAVWVADAQSGAVSRVDPTSLRVTGTFRVGVAGATGVSDPDQVAVFDGWVWVTDGQAATVTSLDPSNGRQHGAPASLPGAPRRLVEADGSLWATTANPGTVVTLVPG
ncbi:MAG TPA: hypothetical protein VMV14_08280 [Acidimicrobiales bacterium]|nr:hypothetical protein [Acidimicrobiales bacterium]